MKIGQRIYDRSRPAIRGWFGGWTKYSARCVTATGRVLIAKENVSRVPLEFDRRKRHAVGQ